MPLKKIAPPQTFRYLLMTPPGAMYNLQRKACLTPYYLQMEK